MSRNQRDRDQFIAECTRAGIGVHLARVLLRKAATAQRLAEAQCNGDWPYNGDRDRPSRLPVEAEARARWDRRYGVCPYCEASGVAKAELKRGYLARGERGSWSRTIDPSCPDCRNTGQIARAMAEGDHGYFARVGGDPRGWVVRLYPKGTPEAEIQDGRARGIGVPA